MAQMSDKMIEKHDEKQIKRKCKNFMTNTKTIANIIKLRFLVKNIYIIKLRFNYTLNILFYHTK